MARLGTHILRAPQSQKRILHGACVPASLFVAQGCLGQTMAHLELAPNHGRGIHRGQRGLGRHRSV